MTDSLEKVTLENAAEQLKLKIRSAFIELLPEEQWKQMVVVELKRFTQTTSEPKYRGSTEHFDVPSAFSKICAEVFTETLKGQIKTTLMSPEWAGLWGANGNEEISNAIKRWLTENSAALIQATVQGLAAHAAQQIVVGMRHAP